MRAHPPSARRASGIAHPGNSVLLCMISPVCQATLVGGFGNQTERRLELGEGEIGPFRRVLELALGVAVPAEGVAEAVEIGRVANFYGVEEVRWAVEDGGWTWTHAATCSTCAGRAG